MKSLILTLVLLFSLTTKMVADHHVIVLDGFYQGKNVFVKNTIPEDGVGYSVYEVVVNGKITTDETNSGAFEIDLAAIGLAVGDPVSIRIKYKPGLAPKILNPGVLLPPSTFDVAAISVTTEGVLTWKTVNETGKLNFVVEQYKWNRWVAVGQVEGVGTPQENSYRFNLDPHSGKNKVRIQQTDNTGKPRVSETKEFMSSVKKVEFKRFPENNMIHFSAPTSYEIYDYDGNKVKVGYGKLVDLSSLSKGAYYIYYDNSKSSFGVSARNKEDTTSHLILKE